MCTPSPQRAPAAAQAPARPAATAGAAPPCGGRPLCLAVSRAVRSSTPTRLRTRLPLGAAPARASPNPFSTPGPSPFRGGPSRAPRTAHRPRSPARLSSCSLGCAHCAAPPGVRAPESRTAGALVDPGLCTLFPSQCIRRRGALTGPAAGAPTPPSIYCNCRCRPERHTAAAPVPQSRACLFATASACPLRFVPVRCVLFRPLHPGYFSCCSPRRGALTPAAGVGTYLFFCFRQVDGLASCAFSLNLAGQRPLYRFPSHSCRLC